MRRRKKYILFSLLTLWPLLSAVAQDTSRRAVTLPEVSVVGKNQPPNTLTVHKPTQAVAVERMERVGGNLLADAIRQMAGATLKDYGGVGGIKTVSVRGMGSQFSLLTIDGVAVNDCQNGQVDLGRYTLAGSSFVTLANGQNDLPLQSARSFSAGSVLNMETREPDFGYRHHRGKVGVEVGSFGYVAPSLGYEQRLGSKGSLSLYGNYMRSQGNYPFTLYYTNGRTDSSSRERRQNSAVETGTADANFFYRFDARRRLNVKVHYMQGQHQLPGPVIYYRVKESGEHTEERLFFSQARYRQTGRHWDWQLLGKYQYSFDLYEDTANNAGRVLNHYTQQEGYLSQGVRFHTGDQDTGMAPGMDDWLSISVSSDESLSHLTSNLSKNNEVDRLSLQGVLNTEYKVHLWEALRGLALNAHLLGTYVEDRQPTPPSGDTQDGSRYAKVSPYAGMTFTRGQFTVRYFFKENYRVPNFNELYYFTVGRTLRPEKGSQHNVGLSYHSGTQRLSQVLRHRGQLTVDLYYNQVTDKIVAFPTQNMFIWSMRNLGQVEIMGADVAGSYNLYHTRREGYSLDLAVGYSYQHAVDRTDPRSKVYGHQIAYTPRHSGSASLVVTTPWVNVGYAVTVVGTRYSGDQNTDRNRMEPYSDHGITLSRDFPVGGTLLKVKAQVLNLFDTQYEVVRSYPMTGRNFRVGVTWEM